MHIQQVDLLLLVPVIAHCGQLLVQFLVFWIVHLELASDVGNLWLEIS